MRRILSCVSLFCGVLLGCAPELTLETVASVQQELTQSSAVSYTVYYGHLHNHSNVSDGFGTPAQAYAYARDTANLDFFALADHAGSISSTEWSATKAAADSYNQDGVFTALWGFEWSSNSNWGHVAVIGTSDYTTESTPSTSTFQGLDAWLSARDGVAFLNHPGREDRGQEFTHFSYSASEAIVGMELFNKTSGFSTFYYNDGYYTGDGGLGYYDEALTRGYRIGASGADDNHSATWGTATNYRFAILAPSLTRDDLLAAMRARRFYSTLDKNLGLSFTMDGQPMGAAIPAASSRISIHATDADGEVFSQIELVRGGAVLQTWTPNIANPTVEATLDTRAGEYFYAVVRQNDGDQAISSPIWVTQGIAENQPPSVNLSNPLSGSTYSAGADISLAADAADAEGPVSVVKFFDNGALLFEDTNVPFAYSWANAGVGNHLVTAVAVDHEGAATVASAVEVTVVASGTPYTAQSRIIASYDDAEESAAGTMYMDSSDLELVNDGNAGNQTVGLRFLNLGIPQGATIANAYIQFRVDERTTSACSLLLRGEAADNSSALAAATRNLSSRNPTTASVSWVPASWNTVGAEGTNQRTPNLASIIQEIVSRSGYNAASAVTLLITGSGKRTAESYEGMASAAPLLVVEYQL